MAPSVINVRKGRITIDASVIQAYLGQNWRRTVAWEGRSVDLVLDQLAVG